MTAKAKSKYTIGFDLGGTKMLASVFDAEFRERGRKRRKTKAQAGRKAGLARIIETIHDAVAEAGIPPDELNAIGVGSPGPLDLNSGVILDTPNLPFKNLALREELEKEFGCPAVIANDVDAGVYGEYRFGAAKGARCAFGVFPGTGIGGGCVYGGQIIRGSKYSCFEIGHCQVLPDGPLCGCGNRGCLEAVGSRLAIASAIAAAAFRGDAPHILESVGMDLSNMRSGAIAAAVEAGDEAVEKIVRQAARWLGVGIGIAVNLMAPDVVVLGGGLVEAMPDLYLDEVSQAAREHVMPTFRGSFRINVAKLGDDATLRGAAAWAQEQLAGNHG